MRSYKWSGFYAGFQGGYSATHFSADSGPFPGAYNQSYGVTSTGFQGGVHFGYNYQFGHYLLGAEVDLEGMNHNGQSGGSLGSSRVQDIDWQSSLRARLGWVSGPWLLYGAGGVVFAAGDTSLPGASFTNRYTGWTAGLGVERAITNAASLRLEYRYIDYGVSKNADTVTNTQDKTSAYDNAVRLGLSFRF